MKAVTEENTSVKKQNIVVGFWDKLFAPKAPMASRKALPFKWYEWIIIISITVFYAFYGLSDLGDKYAPQTYVTIPQNTSIELAVADDANIRYICWYFWEVQHLPFKVEVKYTNDSEWVLLDDVETKSIFGGWNGFALPTSVKQVRVTHETSPVSLKEMVLLDTDGYVVTPMDTSVYPELFDEQGLVADEFTYRSSYYFDEMLYTLTAFEFLNDLPAYEITHPPFGKILIAFSIYLWGVNPFGVRFIGALLGVLMLPILYLLARNITGNRGVSAFITFIFAFDFMHFTQTRLATIDVYITFFIIIMYYFMERYLRVSFYDTSLKKTWIPLGCCGIAFGFGIASKWTGFYAGAGLALLFFSRMISYYKEYRYALLTPEETTNDISHRHIIDVFKSNTCKTIMFCVLFYVVIPFIIYVLSYIPFIDENNAGLIPKMIVNQKFMWAYHSGADFPNKYLSRWYEWPLMIRPMRYCSMNLGGIARQGITAMGNPAVWWPGIPAFLFTLYMAIGKKKKEARFLCVGYLAQYLPWVFISRPTFIYHYFTSVPFVTLMIGYCFLQLKDKAIQKKVLDEKSFYCLLIIYGAVVFGLFQLFYPVLAGQTVSIFYVQDYLTWFKSWEFVVY